MISMYLLLNRNKCAVLLLLSNQEKSVVVILVPLKILSRPKNAIVLIVKMIVINLLILKNQMEESFLLKKILMDSLRIGIVNVRNKIKSKKVINIIKYVIHVLIILIRLWNVVKNSLSLRYSI
jgi:hypothetical protein